MNASYNVAENLISRLAYYHTVGRPDFNQYSGGLTLPDIEQPKPGDRITVEYLVGVPVRVSRADSSAA